MRRIGIIGFPMDLGGNRRGVDMGPSALRLTSMTTRLTNMGIDVVELGNVLVRTRGLVDSGSGDAHFVEEILRACDAAAQMTVDAVERECVPMLLGGDHSVAIGSLRGMASAKGGPGGAIWIDAHADLNTPATSPAATCTACRSPSRSVAASTTFASPRIAGPPVRSTTGRPSSSRCATSTSTSARSCERPRRRA